MPDLTNALGLATLVHVFCMAWTISLPLGNLIPPWAIALHVPCMVIMAFTHAGYHLGAKQAAGFLGTTVLVEWTWEQLNASYDGFIFGRLSYHDTLIGPKLGDIPLIVPFAFAALCWPALVMTNTILHGHPIKSSAREGNAQFLCRCVVFAFLHLAWSPCVEPVVFKFGGFGYPKVGAQGGGQWKAGTFFSIPFTEFRGWWLMAFTCYVLYEKLVAPCLTPVPPRRPTSPVIDSSPLILFGGFCVWLILRPVDPAAGLFALFAMGMPLLQCMYILFFKPHEGDEDDQELDPDFVPPVADVADEEDEEAHELPEEESDEEEAEEDDEEEEEDYMPVRRSTRLRKSSRRR